jgi:RNA polymerase sigma-70 factor (ECF subfamily)
VTVAVAPREHPPRARERELDDVTLARAQRGDAAAWRALVEHHQNAVFALLGRLLGGGRRATVEDLAQETFLAVFRQLPAFQSTGPARLSTWILTIASRRAIDELRKRPASPVLVDDIAVRDDAFDRRRLAVAIDRALADLSPEYRAAFVLRELHGLEYADIARALEIDLGTVKSRLARARDALRRALAEVHQP